MQKYLFFNNPPHILTIKKAQPIHLVNIHYNKQQQY